MSFEDCAAAEVTVAIEMAVDRGVYGSEFPHCGVLVFSVGTRNSLVVLPLALAVPEVGGWLRQS